MVLHPRQKFTCSCSCVHKDVSISFAIADATTNGVASVMKTQPGDDVVNKVAMDWELLKTLHEEGRLVVVKKGQGLYLEALASETPMGRAADSMMATVIENKDLSVDEKRHLAYAMLAALPPEPEDDVAAGETPPPAEAKKETEAYYPPTKFGERYIDTPPCVKAPPTEPAGEAVCNEAAVAVMEPPKSEEALPIRPLPPEDEDQAGVGRHSKKKK